MARILIIDDDVNTRNPVRIRLKEDGHEVKEAENGSEGVAICRECLPDLVICDIMMPEMDGFETIRSLKKESPHLPILIISGSLPAYLEMAPDLGADFILAKPFKLSDLQNAVGELTGSDSRGPS